MLPGVQVDSILEWCCMAQIPHYIHTWMLPGVQVDSILEAVFIVSPKMENLGLRLPTSPVTQGPECRPMRMLTGCPLWGIKTWGEGEGNGDDRE